MDPNNCTSWKPDQEQTKEDRNLRLIELLSGAWANKDIDRIERYDDTVIDGVEYDGWAMWKK